MDHIILIGFMGAGKTTVGKALAGECALPFVDTDSCIEQQQGRKISDIFEKEGEAYFRGLETELIRTFVHSDRSVISVGGGLPVQEENWPILKELGRTIYLKASKGTLLERLQGDTSRPLLQGGELEQRIETLMEKREQTYEKVADVTIVTDGRMLEDVIKEIRNMIEKEGLKDE